MISTIPSSEKIMAEKKRALSNSEIKQNRTDSIMNTIAERCAYYRANPHRFVEEFLGIHLKLFQKILIYAMMVYDNFYFVAARGIGKTFLVAIFAVCRCILYPGSTIVACSCTFKQGKEIAMKIVDLMMPKSALLRNEISDYTIARDDCAIYFKNGSYLKICVASENSRGARSNIIIVDEARMVNQHIVDTVFRPMNAVPRQPGYLSKPEYAHLQEMNKEMYMSSAWYCASEMYDKVKAYTANMLDPNLNYFICDLPYQLSIAEQLLMRRQIENEMSEATFSDIAFSMEREGLFYGATDDALFDFKVLNERRVVSDALLDLEYYRRNNVKIPDKTKGELRILSLDIALMATKKHDNDASALIIHSAIPTPTHNYIDNVVHINTQEGLVTDDLGLLTMRYFYQYDCDYIVIDGNGIGVSICDFIMSDRYDPVYGQTYGALDCINSPEMSARCKVKRARKAIYVIKANAKLNNDMCLALRAGLQNGYVNLLAGETQSEEILSKMGGFSKLSEYFQAMCKLPYIQTTFLINELINLTHDISNGMIKIKEKSGMRKDRFSSLQYGYWIITQELGKKLKPQESGEGALSKLHYKKPIYGLSSHGTY